MSDPFRTPSGDTDHPSSWAPPSPRPVAPANPYGGYPQGGYPQEVATPWAPNPAAPQPAPPSPALTQPWAQVPAMTGHRRHRPPGRSWPVAWIVVAVAAVVALLATAALTLGRDGRPEGSATASSAGAGDPERPAVRPATVLPLETSQRPGRLSAGAARPVVTPQVAKATAVAWWPRYAETMNALDVRGLRHLVTGAAYDWSAGGITCGCLTRWPRLPLLAAKVYVPAQYAYPAYFVAEVRTHSGSIPYTEVLVFTRQSPRTPWLVVENSAAVPRTLLAASAPALTRGGFAKAVPDWQRQRASTLAAELALRWHDANNGVKSTVEQTFASTPVVDDTLEGFDQVRQDSVNENGLRVHRTFSTSRRDPLVVVARSDGSALACQPVHDRVTFSAGSGGYLRQGRSRAEWGAGIPPGLYPSLVKRAVSQTCFVVDSDPDRPVIVLDREHREGWLSIT